MTISKRSLVAGAVVAAVGMAGVGSVGLASAATPSNSMANTSIVDKIAAKFNVNKADVQAVFDEDHSDHTAQMQQRMDDQLSQAVTDGKLTQDQADHIKQVATEVKALLGDKRPDELDDSTRQQVKDKLDGLRTWAQQNNIDTRYVMMGGPGMGRPGRDAPQDDSASDDGSDSQTDAAPSSNDI